MTHKIKLLGRLRDTRKRVRDVAAAGVVAAEARRSAAEEDKDGAAGALDELDRDAVTRFEEAESVRALWQHELERRGRMETLRAAELRLVEEARQTELSRRALVEKERELRRAEKVMANEKSRVQVEERKREQKAADDAAGRRR